mgnify:CR=1 FL=1
MYPQLIVYVLAACVVLLGTGSAIADDEHRNHNASLKGTYRIFTTLNNVGSTAILKSLGVITYDGKGHAQMSDSGTIIDSNSGAAISFEETGKFTYKVNRDGSFTQEGTFTSHPIGEPGGYVITGVKWVGQIGGRGSILMISGTIPPEPQIFTSEGRVPSVRFGVMTGTAVRMDKE